MKVSELFSQLSYGELSNLSVGTDGSGSIEEQKFPQIIGYINDGLLRLFSRFLLKEKDLMIEQVRHITNYHLRRQFAESSGSDEPWPYIKDLAEEPFEEDVIKILEVHDSLGRELKLNDKNDPTSLFTPTPVTLQVPNPVAGQSLGISYQARHTKLIADMDDVEKLMDQEIDLPFTFEGALKSFVAYKVYSHMNGQENAVKAQEHVAAYENICYEVEQGDLVNMTFSTSHTKLEQRGFI